jgi:16S rRNA (guanine(527)-N(7))-methyltransferase RsmG
MIKEAQWSEAAAFLGGLGISHNLLGAQAFKKDLGKYLEMLLRKNEEVNLTALRDPDTAFWKHLVDSLTILQWEDLGNVVDWGSGGGLPGIPLALARRSEGEGATVDFLDSVGKKVRAIQEFGEGLGLSQSRYLNGRGEDLIKAGQLAEVETIVMRAVAPAERAVGWLNRAVPRWVFLLGPQQLDLWMLEEKKVRKKGFGFFRQAAFELPHGHGQRVLLELTKV